MLFQLLGCCCCSISYLILISTFLFIAKSLYKKWTTARLEKMLERWGSSDNVPKDKLIVHCVPRGKTIPNPSPFVLKVETYLRICGIKYEVDTTDPFGPKGKTPWISLNGEHIADSQFIVEFISKKFEKNFSKNVDEETLAKATLSRVVLEEHFFWGFVLERFVFNGYLQLERFMEFHKFHFVFKRIVSLIANFRSKCQGIGHHSEAEIVYLMKKDLKAVSVLLGNRKFICGDQPTEEDSAIFAMISQVIFTLPDSAYDRYIKEELPNLEEYCHRVKNTYWSDWDQNLLKKM